MTAPDPRAIAARLSDQMRAEGWIEHDGGPMPVDGETIVRVRFRDGIEGGLVRGKVWKMRPDQWRHRNSPYDIIAYRKEPTP